MPVVIKVPFVKRLMHQKYFCESESFQWPVSLLSQHKLPTSDLGRHQKWNDRHKSFRESQRCVADFGRHHNIERADLNPLGKAPCPFLLQNADLFLFSPCFEISQSLKAQRKLLVFITGQSLNNSLVSEKEPALCILQSGSF